MSIKLKIDSKPEPQAAVRLNARRSLDGNLMIFDHEDIDIIVMPNKGKVLTLAKDMISDKVYEAQERLFQFLRRKGLIEYGTVRAGNVYGSMEAKL